MPAISDKISQPVVSSTTPADRMTTPMLRLVRSRSIRILAITGIAEMVIAVARNNAKSRRLELSVRNSAGVNKPSARPPANGMNMPISDEVSAERPRWRNSRTSVSRPVSSNKSTMPIHATTSSRWTCSGSGGKIAANPLGHSQPSSDGPSNRPAISSPITAGCPMRFMISASIRDTARISEIWMSNRNSACPGSAGTDVIRAQTLADPC